MTANEMVTAAVLDQVVRRGLTRAELARQLGVTRAWVTHKLNGHRHWGMDDLDLVSERLGIPVAWLLMPPTGEAEVTRLVGAAQVTAEYRRGRSAVTGRYQHGLQAEFELAA